MTDTPRKNALVSDAVASKFATEKATPYTRWIEQEGLDILNSMYVPDLHTVELKPWARREASRHLAPGPDQAPDQAPGP